MPRGVMEVDHTMMDLLDEWAVSYQIVLTKADKISARELEEVEAQVVQASSRHAAAYPGLIITSAEKGTGLKALRNALATLLLKS